jgi:hypothetical protein
MIDLKNDILISNLLNIGAITTNTTTTSEKIDTKGYNSLTFGFYTGTITDGIYTPSFEGSNDGTTNWTVLGSDELLGTIANATLTATSDTLIKTIGIASRYRYYRAKIVSTSITTGGTLGIFCILSYATSLPTLSN